MSDDKIILSLDELLDGYERLSAGSFNPALLNLLVSQHPLHAPALRRYAVMQLSSLAATAEEVAAESDELPAGAEAALHQRMAAMRQRQAAAPQPPEAQAGGEAVAWMRPSDGDALSAARLDTLRHHNGKPGQALAAVYSVPLGVISAPPAQPLAWVDADDLAWLKQAGVAATTLYDAAQKRDGQVPLYTAPPAQAAEAREPSDAMLLALVFDDPATGETLMPAQRAAAIARGRERYAAMLAAAQPQGAAEGQAGTGSAT